MLNVNLINLVVCFSGVHNTNVKYESLFKNVLITVIKIINGKKYFMNSLEIILYDDKVVYSCLRSIKISALGIYTAA